MAFELISHVKGSMSKRDQILEFMQCVNEI